MSHHPTSPLQANSQLTCLSFPFKALSLSRLGFAITALSWQRSPELPLNFGSTNPEIPGFACSAGLPKGTLAWDGEAWLAGRVLLASQSLGWVAFLPFLPLLYEQ